MQNIIAITLKIFTLFFVILFFSNNINDIIGGIINIMYIYFVLLYMCIKIFFNQKISETKKKLKINIPMNKIMWMIYVTLRLFNVLIIIESIFFILIKKICYIYFLNMIFIYPN